MSSRAKDRHLVAVLLENEPGALARVLGLFAQRGYNIETLNVAPTEDPTLSRLTLSKNADERTMEQVSKQLNKLVEVVKVTVLSEIRHVERELMLVKVRVQDEPSRAEIKRTADVFHGQIVDVTQFSYTVQLVGSAAKLDSFLAAISADIMETVRSGVSGIARGEAY